MGDRAEILCENPLQYPLFLPAVVPLYLSVVSSYMRRVKDKLDGYFFEGNFSQNNFKFQFSNSCNEAVEIVKAELKSKTISVSYNPGRGRFIWPPPAFDP